MNILILPIKKLYLDQIKKGTKTIEYRDYSNFYKYRLKQDWTHLKLHYYKSDYIIVKIKSIKVIARPKEFETSTFLRHSKCFAIYLDGIVDASK